ncbi:MAG TPA: energy transducer TonB [Rhizomicrobium sp.]|nr:energy transducer TonB [Rhizomicrobium sp.]
MTRLEVILAAALAAAAAQAQVTAPAAVRTGPSVTDFSIPADTVPPKPTAPHICPVSQYPGTAVRTGQQGMTDLVFTIGVDGRVHDVTVLASSGHDALDQAAVSCTNDWIYTPAQRGGIAVPVTWTATTYFGLNGRRMLAAHIDAAASQPCRQPPAGAKPQVATVLAVDVGTDGKAIATRLARSSADGAFDSYVGTCVAHWTFVPATIDGAAIESWHAEIVNP